MFVLDGNAIAATEHRLAETRDNSAAPLPGKSLCIFQPSYQLITHVVPCEDGHTPERALVGPILDLVKADTLWVADRNFCFQSFLMGIAKKVGFFVIREHAGLNYKMASELREVGRSETGKVFEQDILIGDGEDGVVLRARRVVVKLDKPTGDGDGELAIVTNLPASVSAIVVAEVYRKRWTIEGGFLDLR